MRWVRPALVGAIAIAVFLLAPGGESRAIPGAGGATLTFSVRDIGPAPDITAFAQPGPPFLTCASADILTPPGSGPAGPCFAPAPRPAGPVPDAVTIAFVDLGLDGGGAFSDDLDAHSWGELVGTGSVDFDFSVDAHPANAGTTTALGMSCGVAPDVTTEAAGLEAQGDVFTTTGVAFGCNTQAPGCPPPAGALPCDEFNLGLQAPNPAAPGMPPSDDVDALADIDLSAGPPPGLCSVAGGSILTICSVFSLTGLSATFPGIVPDALSGMPPDEGSILEPPGAPPAPPAQPVACPGPGPCVVVHSTSLGLVPGLGIPGAGDDIDALCWWDGNGNGLPDLPTVLTPGFPGDYYLFSLTPGDPSVVGGPMFSPADLLAPTAAAPMVAGVPRVARTARSLGLLATDNLDALICHDSDADADGAPDGLAPRILDNCPGVNDPSQMDSDLDGMGDVCDPDPFDTDFDNDGVIDGTDNCVVNANGDQLNTDLDLFNTGARQGKMMGGVIPPLPPDNLGNVCDPDDDNDGYSETAEGAIGTADNDNCTAGSGPGPNTDAWPPDMDLSNAVNISDLVPFKAHFGATDPGDPIYDARFDLDVSGNINISDLVPFKVHFGMNCT